MRFLLNLSSGLSDRRPHLGKLGSGLAVAILVLATGGCQNASHQGVLSLVTGKPTLTELDLGQPGPSVGDQAVFSAEVLRDGQHAGWVYGTKILVALPGQSGADARLGRFLNQLTFDLGTGTITVQGIQDVPIVGGRTDFKLGKPSREERVITGGTGSFKGAKGSVTAETRPDGGRIQRFEFL